MQQGQNQKEILVQLVCSAFNLRTVGGWNRIEGQQNLYQEIKIQINQTTVMVDTMVGDFEDTVAITQNLFAEVVTFLCQSMPIILLWAVDFAKHTTEYTAAHSDSFLLLYIYITKLT